MGKVAEQKVRMWLGVDAVWIPLATYLVDHLKLDDLEPLNIMNGKCSTFRMTGILSVDPNPTPSVMMEYYTQNAGFVRLHQQQGCILELPTKIPVRTQIDAEAFKKLLE